MKKSILLVIFSILFFILGQNTFASIAPPITVVNHTTKECSVISLGDECVRCSLIDDWENISSSHGKYEECPVGYTIINLEYGEDYICEGRKTQFCCTVDHSGAAGNCEDVVVNDTKKQCAFVEDINECERLPAGWEQAGMDVFWGQVCPSLGYKWVDDVECVAGKGGEKIVLMGRKDVIDYILYTILFAVAVATALVILWFLFKRKGKQK